MLARSAAVVVVVVAAGLFVAAGIRDMRVTDSQIQAGDPADTLGLGIYPVLAVLGIPAVLAPAWLRRNTPIGRRASSVALTVVLLAAAAFCTWAYNGLRARVFR
jgi:hypothetical protein